MEGLKPETPPKPSFDTIFSNPAKILSAFQKEKEIRLVQLLSK